MTRLASVVFALLLAATGAAFFVEQRLKQSPRIVRTLFVTHAFSPRLAQKASIRIRLEQPDDATVSVVDAGGDPVRRLVNNRRYVPAQKVQLFWNGRDEAGRLAPDGEYRVRVSLRHHGRSVVLLDTVTVDDTPPRPIVRVKRRQDTRGPLLVPQRDGRAVRFSVTGTHLPRERLLLYRTDGARPRLVARLPRRASQDAEGTWDGRIAGRPAPPGPYVIVARDSDGVGNVGWSFPFTPVREGDPPGGAGVTVRYLAVQPPQAPVAAGRLAPVFIDSRGRHYSWRLHRLGVGRTLAHGSSRSPSLRVRAPRGLSGVYELEVSSGGHRATALIPVQGPGRSRGLVVLPVISWQGSNPTDADGDGLVDTLDRGGRARLDRPLAPAGLPPGFGANELPVLWLLDRPHQRYDITTDAALSGPGGVRELQRHRGVLLLGNPRWLTLRLTGALRGFVQQGGRVFSPGTGSLRRTVRLEHEALTEPSRPSTADVFGANLAPIAHRRVELLAGRDSVGLFRGGDGLFRGFTALEETLAAGPGARVVAVAEEQGARTGAPVIVAARVGRGLVIRTGLPEWGRRLGRDPNVQALTRQAWLLVSR